MVRNYTIDFFRFIFSICIIAIHVSLFKNINMPIYNLTCMGIMRIGVPFFFVVSGYFYYRRIDQKSHTKEYIKKLIKLFVIFEGLELIIYIPAYISSLTSVSNILILIWRALTVGMGGIYWYMSSLIISLIIMTPLWKKKKIIPCLIIGFLLYLITGTNDVYGTIYEGMFIQNIAKINTTLFAWPQAGLTSSLLYLSIGALLYEYKPKIKYLNILTIVSIIILLLESFVLQNNGAYDANCYLSLVICVPLVFMYILENDFIHFDTRRLGSMSVYIYMLHPIVLNVLRFLIPFFNSSNELLFIVCCIIVVPLSYLISKKITD